MLYVFDLDDTLIEGYLNPKRPYDRVEPLPGRAEKLAELMGAGHEVAIVTNQGGVAFGHVTEDHFHSKMYDALFKLGLPLSTAYAVCFSDSRSKKSEYNKPEDCARRKPSGAMIREVASAYELLESRVMYIGDRPEDEAAAADCGIPFQWTWQFFGDAAPITPDVSR